MIIAAIIGHAVAGSESISAGNCVITNPSLTSGWDIQKVGCAAQTSGGQTIDLVVQVLSGSDETCYNLGYSGTTFNDQNTNQTYCLQPYSSYGP